jgi:hypothetical protein
MVIGWCARSVAIDWNKVNRCGCEMSSLDGKPATKPLANFMSAIRLLIFAVLLPAAVAGTNQWITPEMTVRAWLERRLAGWRARN